MKNSNATTHYVFRSQSSVTRRTTAKIIPMSRRGVTGPARMTAMTGFAAVYSLTRRIAPSLVNSVCPRVGCAMEITTVTQKRMRQIAVDVVIYTSHSTTKPTNDLSQISLVLRPVWSESSLSAWRNLWSFATCWVRSEDLPQADVSSMGAHVILLVCHAATQLL